MDLASHHIDTLRFLFDDEVRSVSANVWTGCETAMLDIVMRRGLHAQVVVAYGTVEEDSLEVFGSTAKLRVSRYDSLALERSSVVPKGGVAGSVIRLATQLGAVGYSVKKIRSPGGDPSFAASIAHFLVAARDGRPAGPDLADGLRAAEVIDAARASAAERRTIDLF
jgi:predicted dehydrogenase